jgi:hypothetical protein
VVVVDAICLEDLLIVEFSEFRSADVEVETSSYQSSISRSALGLYLLFVFAASLVMY